MRRCYRDERWIRLDCTMARLGFHKRLEHFRPEDRNLPDHLEYTDVRGNGLSCEFRKNQKGEISPRMSLNDNQARSWNKFNRFIDDLCDTIEDWLKEQDNPRILGSSCARKNPNRSLRGKEVVIDVRAGMDDSTLRTKYGLTPQGLTNLLEKLVWEGLLSPNEVAERSSAGTDGELPVYQCNTCSELQFAMLANCPHCGGMMSPKRD